LSSDRFGNLVVKTDLSLSFRDQPLFEFTEPEELALLSSPLTSQVQLSSMVQSHLNLSQVQDLSIDQVQLSSIVQSHLSFTQVEFTLSEPECLERLSSTLGVTFDEDRDDESHEDQPQFQLELQPPPPSLANRLVLIVSIKNNITAKLTMFLTVFIHFFINNKM
jgi:hypothetical protein